MFRRLLILVCAIVLVDVAFYTAINPLLGYYTDELSLSKSQAGVLAGAYAAGTLAASIPAAWIAARIGPRTTLLWALGLLTVACVIFGFAQRYELLVAARLAQGMSGAGAWAAGLSWLIAATPRGRRGEVIGTALGVAIAGAFGGPVLGAFAEATSPSLVFSTVAGVTLLLAIGVIGTPAPAPATATGGLRRALSHRHVLAGGWLTMFAALFFGATTVLTSLRLDDLGVGAAGIAVVFLVAAAAEATVSPFVGRLSDRRGRLLPLRAGAVAVLLGCIALPLAERASWLLAIVVVVALGAAGMLWAPAMALISEGAESAGATQAMAFGIVNLVWAGGQVGGSAGGSAVADATSDAFTYGLLGALAVVSIVALARARAGLAAGAGDVAAATSRAA